MTMAAVLLISVFIHNSQKFFDKWGKASKVSAYLKSNSTEGDRNEINGFLNQHKLVRSFKFVDSEQSAKKFEKHFSKISSEKLSSDKLKSFFPSYYLIELKQDEAYHNGVSALENFKTNLQAQLPIFSKISYGKKWLDRYVSLLTNVNLFAYIFIILFMAASFVICANIIKTLLYNRKDEIEILEFIGASETSIYFPHVVNIVILSLSAYLLSSLMVYGALSSFNNSSVFSFANEDKVVFIPMYQYLLYGMTIVFGCSSYSVFTIFNLLPGRKKSQIIKEVIS